MALEAILNPVAEVCDLGKAGLREAGYSVLGCPVSINLATFLRLLLVEQRTSRQRFGFH